MKQYLKESNNGGRYLVKKKVHKIKQKYNQINVL